VSTDLTRASAELTRDLLNGIGLRSAVIQSSALSLPIRDNVFDCVYSFGVLHHFPGIEAALAEIHRVLKPGGQVMVMLYHMDSLLYAYSIIYWRGIKEGLLRTLTPEELVSCYSERNEGCPYTRAFTKDEATNLFSSQFKQVTTEVHYSVVDLPEQRKVKIDVPDKYELGWHLVVRAVK
jgi:ubiquinone/menaquinone biosynthesis C-methylase UbiE